MELTFNVQLWKCIRSKVDSPIIEHLVENNTVVTTQSVVEFENNLYSLDGHFIQLLNHSIPFRFVKNMPLQNKGDLPH